MPDYNPQPKVPSVGAWSIFSQSKFPAEDRPLTAEEQERVSHMVRLPCVVKVARQG
jgi:hypothetical protein